MFGVKTDRLESYIPVTTTGPRGAERVSAAQTDDTQVSCLGRARQFLSDLATCFTNCMGGGGDTGVDERSQLLSGSGTQAADIRDPIGYGLTINMAPRQVEMTDMRATATTVTHSGSLPIPPKLGSNAQMAIQEFRRLLVESNDTPAPNLLRSDPGLRTEPLTQAEKKEILAALKDSGWNWFAMIKDQSNNKELIRNTRMFQKEMTDTLKHAINADDRLETKKFSAVGSTDLTSDLDYTIEDGNQAKQVALMNEAFRAIFQKEPGIVFDTNFYSAHVVLKEGFQITNPVHEKTWMDSNEVAARVKVALHFTSLNPEAHPDTFEGSQFQTSYVTPMITTHIEVALAKAGVTADSAEGQAISARITDTETQSYKEAYLKVADRADAIETRTQAVKAKAEAEVALLTAAPHSQEKEVSLSLLTSKLADPAALEMEAMNIIYAEKMAILETATTEFKHLESLTNGMIQAATEHGVSESDIQAWMTNPSLDIGLPAADKAFLRGMKDQLDEKGLAAIQFQMETLQYANEPYFAQTTIVGVVKGMQASSGKTADEVAQMKKDFPIMSRTEMNTHAMEENFGDLVKDMHHYHEKPDDFLTRGAKYLDRMLIFGGKAAEELPGVPTELKQEIAAFKELSGELLGLRKNGDMLPTEKAMRATELVKKHFGVSGEHLGETGEMAHRLFEKALHLEARILAYTEK